MDASGTAGPGCRADLPTHASVSPAHRSLTACGPGGGSLLDVGWRGGEFTSWTFSPSVQDNPCVLMSLVRFISALHANFGVLRCLLVCLFACLLGAVEAAVPSTLRFVNVSVTFAGDVAKLSLAAAGVTSAIRRAVLGHVTAIGTVQLSLSRVFVVGIASSRDGAGRPSTGSRRTQVREHTLVMLLRIVPSQ